MPANADAIAGSWVSLNLCFSELVDTHDKLAGWQMPSSQFFCPSKSLSYCSAAPIEAEPALLTKLTERDHSWAGFGTEDYPSYPGVGSATLDRRLAASRGS